MICANEEHNDDEPASHVTNFTVVKLILCLVIQRHLEIHHFDFCNAFPNKNIGPYTRTIPNLLEIMLSTWKSAKIEKVTIRLARCRKNMVGNSIEQVQIIWLIGDEKQTLRDLQEERIAVCYVIDQLVSSQEENELEKFKTVLKKHFVLNSLGYRKHISGTEIISLRNHSIKLKQSDLI